MRITDLLDRRSVSLTEAPKTKSETLMETSEYGNTDINAIIAGDRNFNYEDHESFGSMGFSKQEFNENEELVDVEDSADASVDTDDFQEDVPDEE